MREFLAQKMDLPNIQNHMQSVTFTSPVSGWPRVYDPFHDDHQMAALVKYLHLSILCYRDDTDGWMWMVQQGATPAIADYNLNSAVVRCAVNLFSEKKMAA
jgi:hypothetical protein